MHLLTAFAGMVYLGGKAKSASSASGAMFGQGTGLGDGTAKPSVFWYFVSRPKVNGSIPAGYNGVKHAHCTYCGSCLTHKSECNCRQFTSIDPAVLALFGKAARLAARTASKPNLSWYDSQEPKHEPEYLDGPSDALEYP